MSTPYVGPYRVLERRDNSFKIAIPGGTSEKISIARLKPAAMPTDDNNQEQSPAAPPTPPQPGPGPGPPTNPPPPTARRTGSANNQADQTRQRPRPNSRRGVPHIADYNRQQPPRPAPTLPMQDY